MIPEFYMGDRRFFAALCTLVFFVCLPPAQAQTPAGVPAQEQTGKNPATEGMADERLGFIPTAFVAKG